MLHKARAQQHPVHFPTLENGHHHRPPPPPARERNGRRPQSAFSRELPAQPDYVLIDEFSFEVACSLLRDKYPSTLSLRQACNMLGITEDGTNHREHRQIQIVVVAHVPAAPHTTPTRHLHRDGRLRACDFISGCGVRSPGAMAMLNHAMGFETIFRQMHSRWRDDPVEWRFWCFVCKTRVPFGRADCAREPLETTLRGWSLCHICWASPMCPRCADELRDDLPCLHCVSAMQVTTLPARVIQQSASGPRWVGRPESWTINFKAALQLYVTLSYWTRMLQRPNRQLHPSTRRRLAPP